MRNLLTNAFRYGGSNVSVTVRGREDRCLLEVADDGTEIPPEDQERIFEAFQQSSGGEVVSESVGLGLPISRLLAEKMGGSLTYRWSNGRSAFILELPASAPKGSLVAVSQLIPHEVPSAPQATNAGGA